MATEDTLIAFQLQRIYCGLAKASTDGIYDYGKRYKLNNNPTLNPLTLQLPGSDPVALTSVSAGGSAVKIPAGQTVSLVASWTPESVESYPAWDLLKQALLDHKEGMRISWYATGGSLDHDVTGRDETEADTFTDNTWKVGDPGPAHLWVVLHDSRGGTAFAGYDFLVTP
jgi:hypothetical protein